MREDTCDECGNAFIITERWQDEHRLCPDCAEPILLANETPDLVDLMESKKYAKRRGRAAAAALDEMTEFD